MYDEDDNDNYSEGGQDRGGRRPPMRLLEKADKPPTKIEKLSKLVSGANVTIRDIFRAQAIKDNIPEGGKIALINTLASLDGQSEQMHFTEFKSAFR